MARWWLVDRDRRGGSWWARQSHICMQITRRNNCGSRQTTQPRVPARGNKASNLWLKTPVGVEAAGETPSLTGEFVGESYMVLVCTQNHLAGNQHQTSPICLWVEEEVTESWPRAEKVGLFPLRPLFHNAVTWVGCAPPWWIPKALLLTT